MSPEEMEEVLAESGWECAEHGEDCEDENCINVSQEYEANQIEAAVEDGSLTEAEAIAAHKANGTWEPTDG